MNKLPSFSRNTFGTYLILFIFLSLEGTSMYGQKDPYIDSLEQIINVQKEDTVTVSALINLSFYIIEGEPGTSLKYSEEGLKLSRKIEWNEGIAWSLMQIALSYDYLANYDSAMIFYRQTFDKRLEMNDRNGMAGVLLNVGGSYHYRGMYSLALDNYLKALTIYKSTNNELGITRCYNNLGNVSRVKKDYQQALNYYLEVKKIREKNKDQEGMMYVYNNISTLFSYIGNYRASIEYGEKSAKLAKQLNKKVDLANALLNIGMGYLAFNDIKNSETSLMESLNLINETEDQQYRAFILSGVGELYLKKGAYQKSIGYLDSAIILAISQQRLELLTKSYKLLSQCYEQMGDNNKSLEYYKIFNELSDSILNQENLRQMNEMNAVYQITETQKENNQLFNAKNAEAKKADRSTFQRNVFIVLTGIVILISILLLLTARRNIRIRKELDVKNNLIQKSLLEKEILLKEIHHRVKNNLQLVSSLLQLQINRTKDESTIEALIESQTRIESMSMIHQHLYSNENIGEINMQIYLSQLAESIEKTYKKPGQLVRTELDIQPNDLPIDIAVPLGIIATELISNSYKYAFEENKDNLLSIVFKRNNQLGYELVIADNGNGADIDNLQTNKDSLGLKLVHLLSRQLRADLKFEHKNGLTIKISGN